MKIKNLFLIISLLTAFYTHAQQISPLTKAVLNGYKAILEENPKDYETLYQRGIEYYKLSLYDQALSDITKALEYTPEKDKSLRTDEYSILSDIYVQTKEYDRALEAVNNALALNPNDYALLYKKGNAELYLKDGEGAYRTFASMQRMKSRSQEAFFGMARACIMTGKIEEARDLISQAEKADPSGYLTFCRIGELYQEMGEDENAAASFLSAFSLAGDDMSRPLNSLILLARKDYPAVETALQYAISKSQNPDALNFLQANIAYTSGNYNQAYVAFTELLKSKEAQISSVYSTMALTCMALNKMTEAQTNADLAVIKGNTPEALITKAKVNYAAGNAPAALMASSKALAIDKNSEEAMVESALANLALEDTKAALQTLNEVALTNPEGIYAMMIRAYINYEITGDTKEGIHQYSKISDMDEENFPGLAYKALAKSIAGKRLDADAMVEKKIAANDNLTKDDYYYAAVYFAQTGNLTKGKEMIDRALALGYQNLYNLYTNKTINLNISPIRHLLPER